MSSISYNNTFIGKTSTSGNISGDGSFDDPITLNDDISLNSVTASKGIIIGIDNTLTGTGSLVNGESNQANGDYSHAEGWNTKTYGPWSHSEGWLTEASNSFSHAEGASSKAIGPYSHAEGAGSVAVGTGSHAEGSQTIASGTLSHTEGYQTITLAVNSHAEGIHTTASAQYSHVEGQSTVAYGIASHAEGQESLTFGEASHAEGWSAKAVGDFSHAEGRNSISGIRYFNLLNGQISLLGDLTSIISLPDYLDVILTSDVSSKKLTQADVLSCTYDSETNTTTIIFQDPLLTGYLILDNSKLDYRDQRWSDNEYYTFGIFSHAEGHETIAAGNGSHSEGNNTIANADFSHTEGRTTRTYQLYSHAEGESTSTYGEASHAEGFSTRTYGDYSHAEGYDTITYGDYSHAEGNSTNATADSSHAEGSSTKTLAEYLHAEGEFTTTTAYASHAEGYNTVTSGAFSHAEGQGTIALGGASHAEGYLTVASGTYSHAEGVQTITDDIQGQHVQGLYNQTGSNAISIIGNGTGAESENRSNIFEAYYDKVVVSGNLDVTNTVTATGIDADDLSVSNITASNILVNNDIRINGTASINVLNTLESNVLQIGDKYITLMTGANTQELLDGAGILFGSGSEGESGDQSSVAHIVYRDAVDKIEIYPGLKVSGSAQILTDLTASKFSGNGSQITNLTASNINNFTNDVRAQITASNNLSYSNGTASLNSNISLTSVTASAGFNGSLTGSASYALDSGKLDGYVRTQFATTGSNNFNGNQSITGYISASTGITGSFSGSGANISNLTASNITNFSSSVRNVFLEGTNITINAVGSQYAISSSGISTVYTAGNITGSGTSGDPVGIKPNPTFTNITASIFTGSSAQLNYLDFNTTVYPSPPPPPAQLGRIFYNGASGDLSTYLDTNGLYLNNGQQLIQKVKNNTGATIDKGKVVRVSGSQGSSDLLYVVTASWQDDPQSANTVGLLMSQLTQSQEGYVLLAGVLTGINTDSYAAGQMLYLSSSGDMTSSTPVPPYHTVRLGHVARKHAVNGSFFVRVQNGYELDELHDVLLNTPTNGDLLVRGADNLWKNSKILSGSYQITNDITASNVKITDSLANGNNVTAFSQYSHAEGIGTIAGYRGFPIYNGESVMSGNFTGVVLSGDNTAPTYIDSYGIEYAEVSSSVYNAVTDQTTIKFKDIALQAILLVAESVVPYNDIRWTNNEGEYNVLGIGSRASGEYSVAYGYSSNAEGYNTRTTNDYSHAEGNSSKAIGSYSHTEGHYTKAFGVASHAEGHLAASVGDYSHAEGRETSSGKRYLTVSNGTSSLIGNFEDVFYPGGEWAFINNNNLASNISNISIQTVSYVDNTTTIIFYESYNGGIILPSDFYGDYRFNNQYFVLGVYSHAEGVDTNTLGQGSHAEGRDTIASNDYSHAEGYLTTAYGYGSHAEGRGTITSASYQHVQGQYNQTSSTALMIVGNGNEGIYGIPNRSNILEVYNNNVVISGTLNVSSSITASSFSGNGANISNLTASNINNFTNDVIAQFTANNNISLSSVTASSLFSGSLANITNITASNVRIADLLNNGYNTTASAVYSHAEGVGCKALQTGSHAEGYYTVATSAYSHAEGHRTLAEKDGSHTEGYYTTASDLYSHAEGAHTKTYGVYSHAEGIYTVTFGNNAHSEGYFTTASGESSHAEGFRTETLATASHAEGYYTIASASYQHVQGRYNQTSSAALMIVGNGTGPASNQRSNILEVYDDKMVLSGNLHLPETKGIVFGSSYASGIVSGTEYPLGLTLDDYEYGSWTATLGAGISSTNTISQQATYIKIGKLIFLKLWIGSATDITFLSTSTITGIPFANNMYGNISAQVTVHSLGGNMTDYTDDPGGVFAATLGQNGTIYTTAMSGQKSYIFQVTYMSN